MRTVSRQMVVLGGLMIVLMMGVTTSVTLNCPDNTYLFFPRSATEPKCMTHPIENCANTFTDDEVAKCNTCKRGYYLDKSSGKDACTPCETDCTDCQGPGLDNCVSLKAGKRYDPTTKQQYSCQPGCSICDRLGNCISCNTGYRTQERLNNGTPVLVNDHAVVDCVLCTLPNCEYCAMTNTTLGMKETCTVCKAGHGPNKFSGRCELCPLNCQNCFTDSAVCDYCSPNYYRDPQSSKCTLIREPNCASFDGQKNRCSWCNQGYTLDHTNGRCVSCATLDPLCTQCAMSYGPFAPSTTSNVPAVCHSCLAEHFFDKETKKCKRCGLHCDFCDNGNGCLSCKQGFSISNGQCVEFAPVGCTYAKDNKCLACDIGYYLDTLSGTCKKCASGCLSCIGEGSERCMWCPVSRLAVKQSNPNSPMVPGAQVKPSICIFVPLAISCVESCKDPYGVTDLLSGECIKGSAQPEPPKNKYAFTITSRTSSEPDATVREIMQDTYTYLMELSKYDMQARINARNWAFQNPEKAKIWSPRCNWKGVLVERINYEREVYFECECMDGHAGIDCAINREEFHSIQKHVLALLTELETYMRAPNQENWLQSFINLNSGSHSRHTLDRLGEALAQYTIGHGKIMFQQQTFLGALDAVFRSHYRHYLQVVRDLNSKRFDTGEAEFKKNLYDRVHKLIHIGRDTLRRSLGLLKDGFVISRSEAFQVSFTRPTKEQVTGGTGEPNLIAVFPPNLMGTSHVSHPVLLNVNCAAVRNDLEKYFIDSWAFSNLLFSKTIYEGILISYVVAVDVASDPTNPAVCGQPGDNLRIRFPLRITPTDTEKGKLRCLAMTFEAASSNHKYTEFPGGNLGYYSESKQPYLECEFGPFQVTSETFFTAGYLGEQSHYHTEKLKRVALDENDDYHLAQYKLPSWAATSVTSLLALWTAVFHL